MSPEERRGWRQVLRESVFGRGVEDYGFGGRQRECSWNLRRHPRELEVRRSVCLVG
jgi:hypothetical protein